MIGRLVKDNNIMRNLKTYLVLVIIGFLASCGTGNDTIKLQEGKVLIEGYVELSQDAPRIISLKCFNAFGGDIKQSQLLDSSGYFKFEPDIFHPQNILLRYGKAVWLLVKPGDLLNLTLHSEFKNDGQSFEISGTGSDASNDNLAYRHFCSKHRFDGEWPPDYSNTSFEDCLTDIRRRTSRVDSLLSVFAKRNDPSEKFIQWAKKNNAYSSANCLMFFKNQHPNFTGNIYDQLLFPVNDDEAIITSAYVQYLRDYLRYHYENDTVVQNLIYKDNIKEALGIALPKILRNEPPGLSREIMSYRMILTLFNKSLKDISSLWVDAEKYLSDKTLIALLNRKKEQYQSPVNYPIALLDFETKEETEITGDFLTSLISAHPGKVIYIDIWSTTCGPCIREIPHSLALQKWYKNEDVVFANLCMTSDRADWKKLIQGMKFSGENYSFNKEQSYLTMSELGPCASPTYMIMDKLGNLVNTDAPRPSSVSIKEELDHWLIN